MAGHVNSRGIKLALISYLFLVSVQLITYWMTGITVLFAQGLEMLSDVFISAFLLLSISISRRPPDARHMLGYGRVENVAGLVSATILIAFMSIETLRESIPKLIQPPSGGDLNLGLGVGVILFGMVVIAIPVVDIMLSKIKGGSVKAQLVSLLKDEASSVISIIGLGMVSLGYVWGDPLASLIIGVIIALSGVYLFSENVSYLVGKSPDSEFFAKMEKMARSIGGVLEIHDMLAEYVGPDRIHASLHIEVARGTLIEDADRIAEEVRDKISEKTGCQSCVVHVDPEKR